MQETAEGVVFSYAFPTSHAYGFSSSPELSPFDHHRRSLRRLLDRALHHRIVNQIDERRAILSSCLTTSTLPAAATVHSIRAHVLT